MGVHGHANVPCSFQNASGKLGHWVGKHWVLYRQQKLGEGRIERLRSLGFVFSLLCFDYHSFFISDPHLVCFFATGMVGEIIGRGLSCALLLLFSNLIFWYLYACVLAIRSSNVVVGAVLGGADRLCGVVL